MSEWRHITLGDLAKANGCTIQTGPFGSQLHKHDYQGGGIGVVNPTHMVDRRVRHESVPCVSSEIAARLSKHQVIPGDLLFARRGEIGRHAVITESERGWLCGTGCFLVRIESPDVDSGFVSYFLSTDDSVDWLNRHAAGVVMPNLSSTALQRVPISLPPLPEQKKIAHILSTVQRAIESEERIIQTTTELKKALMHKLFTEGLRNEPQKQTEMGPVPESWDVVELGEIAIIDRGKFSHRPRNEPRYYGGNYPFVQTGDVANCDGTIRTYSQTLNEDGLAISKMFPAGTILITIAANIGFTGILEFDSACPDSLIGISPNDKVQVGFLNYYLVTQQPEMDRLAPRGTQKNINIQFLKPWPVPVPSIEDQQEIANTICAADRKIRLAGRRQIQLQELFCTLLHELMTAKIRVADINIQQS